MTPSRIESNLNVVPLDDHDMADLNSLHKSTTKRFAKPDWGVHLGLCVSLASLSFRVAHSMYSADY